MAKINKLLVDYGEESETAKPRPYFMRFRALEAFIFGVIINSLSLFLFGKDLLWINAIFIPFAALYVYFAYKKAYYKISKNFVTIGSGVIDTTTNILEIHKIQAVRLKQTIFQKRSGIASLVISTASKSVTIPYISKLEALSIYNFLLYKVESQDRDWM